LAVRFLGGALYIALFPATKGHTGASYFPSTSLTTAR
jgi:hypothetical protein